MRARESDGELLAELGERVTARLASWRPGAAVRDIRPLTGGTSSLTFIVDLDGVPADETPIVLKVAPPGLEPVRNRDVLRQARLQRALQDHGRPLAPAVLFSDPGRPPASPPFMAMNMVPGECLEPILTPADRRPDPAVVFARYLDAAQVLAGLHRAVPVAIGLGDEPVVGLGDEIDRWTRAFETLPEEMRGDYKRAAAALHAAAPEPMPAVVSHGDYRLGNTLCEGDRVAAVIDWEIWSIGDPRADIAWLTYFADDAGHPAAEPGAAAGTPSRAQIVEAYERARGIDLPDLNWFHAMVRYKEAAATGLLLKRAQRTGRETSGPLGRMLTALPKLVEEALTLVEK